MQAGRLNDYVYVYVTRANNSHWHRLLKVMRREDLIDDERYDSPKKRAGRREEVDAIVKPWAAALTKQEAMTALGSAGVPAGAVYDTQELQEDPSFEERGIFQRIEHPTRGAFKMAGWPAKMSANNVPVAPAPLLGEHNEAVLDDWLGLSAADVAELKANGSI